MRLVGGDPMRPELLPLGAVFERMTGAFGDKPFLIVKDRQISYRDLAATAKAVASWLLARGVGKGDKVAVWLPNCIEWAIADFAVASIGAVLVPISTRLGTEDLAWILEHCEASVLMMGERAASKDLVETALAVLPWVGSPGSRGAPRLRCPHLQTVVATSSHRLPGAIPFSRLLETPVDHAGLRRRARSVRFEDPTYIQYTSGTTGFPKGAVHTHRLWVQMWRIGQWLEVTQQDRIFVASPVFHLFGQLAFLMTLTHGATLVLMEHFDPEEAAETLRAGCTVMLGVPTIYQGILESAGFRRSPPETVRTGLIGGSPASVQLIRAVMNHVPRLMSAYGCSETGPSNTQTRIGGPPEKIASTVGRPTYGSEVKVVDPRTGGDAPVGAQGEIWIRGWPVMVGYYKDPGETAKVLDAEGWFHSGDLGCFDEDGYLIMTGRLKDMFISGGTNVYPVEIEQFLSRHPKVREVQLVGVPDERLGEVGMAYVVPRPGAACSEDELLEFCRGRIANYKVPRWVRFVDEFPRTASGKVQKFKLREAAAAAGRPKTTS